MESIPFSPESSNKRVPFALIPAVFRSFFAGMTQNNDELFRHLIQGVKDYAITALDTDGKVITWNHCAERIKEYAADEIIGKHFSVFFREEERKADHPASELKEALKSGSYEEQGWRVRKSGSEFWANVVISPLWDESGKHIGFATVTRDLTDRRSAESEENLSVRALQRSEDTFNSMVSSVRDYAIFVISGSGNILTWNDGAERIKGYTADEVVGRHFSMFYTEEAKRH